MTADQYQDATLRALVDGIKVYSSAGGTILLRTVNKGSIVGEVFSYVVKGSDVWWHLKEGGFVKHGQGLFDAELATDTSSAFAQKLIDGTLNSGGSLFDVVSKFFSGLPTMVAVAVVGFLLFVFVLPFFRR